MTPHEANKVMTLNHWHWHTYLPRLFTAAIFNSFEREKYVKSNLWLNVARSTMSYLVHLTLIEAYSGCIREHST
jgi:hypothetical protein